MAEAQIKTRTMKLKNALERIPAVLDIAGASLFSALDIEMDLSSRQAHEMELSTPLADPSP